jgi:cellulose synthase/poly-beta-1,6-N-acetylglucosamine synthase-like glycosyltransferase
MSSNLRQAPGVTASLYRVAVLVPCYNEERAIAKVVADFPAALPEASVYVCDNNSTDGTIAAAKVAGAIVRRETYQGRAFVVSRTFNDVKGRYLRAGGRRRDFRRAERQLSLFGTFGVAVAIMSVGLAIPIFITYVQEGLVQRQPTAVLSTGLMLLAFLSIAVGLILDTVTRGRRELKLIAYLALRALSEERRWS